MEFKKLLLSLFFLFICIKGFGQENSKKQNQGYRGILETGYNLGIGDERVNFFKLHYINGFWINDKISIGIGTGIQIRKSRGQGLLPVFADFRFDLGNNKAVPYVALGGGYTFAPRQGFDPEGFLSYINSGVKFNQRKKVKMNVGLGFQIRQLDTFWSQSIFKSFSLNYGFSF